MALNPLITLVGYALGYLIKTTPLTKSYTDYIPLCNAIVGAILGYCLDNNLILGLLAGLASTGLYESIDHLVKEPTDELTL